MTTQIIHSQIKGAEIWLDDYGAMGDYSWATSTGTDDSAAVNAAVAAAYALGGAIIRLSPGKVYKVSEITILYPHVSFKGSRPGQEFRNDGINGNINSLKPTSCFVVNSGVFGFHFKQNSTYYGSSCGMIDTAVVCDPNAVTQPNEVLYGVVSSSVSFIMRNVMIYGFGYGYTMWNGDLGNVIENVFVERCTKIGILVPPPPSTGSPITTNDTAAYQHPLFYTNLTTTAPYLTSSTRYIFQEIFCSNNGIGMAIWNGQNAQIDGVINSNYLYGLLIFKATARTLETMNFDIYFENNFNGYYSTAGGNAGQAVTGFPNDTDYAIDGSIPYSAGAYTYAPGDITALRTSAVPEYLKGNVSGVWANTDIDNIGFAIWIGSQLEDDDSKSAGDWVHPYNLEFSGVMHCHGSSNGTLACYQKMIRIRSGQDIRFRNLSTSLGHPVYAIRLDNTLSLMTQFHDLCFDGVTTGTTFETNIYDPGGLGGIGTWVTRPSRAVAGTTTADDSFGVKTLMGNDYGYTRGADTLTLTGCTTSPTGSVQWTKNGNAVTLSIPGFTGTSNSVSKTLTLLGANLWPLSSRQGIAWIQDNGGSYTLSSLTIGTNGVITLAAGYAGAFTASGTFSLSGCSVSYTIN